MCWGEQPIGLRRLRALIRGLGPYAVTWQTDQQPQAQQKSSSVEDMQRFAADFMKGS